MVYVHSENFADFEHFLSMSIHKIIAVSATTRCSCMPDVPSAHEHADGTGVNGQTQLLVMLRSGAGQISLQLFS